MNTRTRHKTEAILLRSLDYGESDRIVMFYTRDYGKLRGIAKGARRSRRRFANALELFCCSEIVFSRKGRDNLALIEESRVYNHFGGIRQDLEKTLMASHLIELTDQFTLEDKKSADLFALLHDFLAQIDGADCTEALLRFFEIRLLKCVGYQPVLDRCVACQAPLNGADVYQFNARAGGIRCSACHRTGEMSLSCSTGTLKTLLMGQDVDLSRMSRLLMSEQSVLESRQILLHFIRHLLGKELKSLQVFHQIRKIGL
jgi:DNA repair protein RecO (recombination protein O)